MQALFLASPGGSEGSLAVAFFRDLTGKEAAVVLAFLSFFAEVFVFTSGEVTVPLFLRFFLTEDLGASGEVDMSRSGSWYPLSIGT